MLAAIGSLSFAGTATQAGRITDVFDSRLLPLVIGNLCLGGGLTTLVIAPALLVASASILVMGAGFGVTLSLYRSIITSYAPPDARGGLVSISEAFGRVTATLTPVVIGAIISIVTPILGFQPAVQIAGLTAAITVSGVNIAGLLAMHGAQPVRNTGRENPR